MKFWVCYVQTTIFPARFPACLRIKDTPYIHSSRGHSTFKRLQLLTSQDCRMSTSLFTLHTDKKCPKMCITPN